MKNLISVILPVYNRAQTIEVAVNSVLTQSNPDFELIIVDDCSTDKTVETIANFRDARINLFQLEKNQGAAAARNIGIRKSRGSIISFLDSDDYYEPDFLKVSRDILKDTPPNIGFMWTGVRYRRGSELKETSWVPVFKENTYLTFLHNLQIGTGAGVCVKREVFENCGYFDEKLPAAEDTEFFLRISQKYDYVYTTDILINVVKDSTDRMSQNFSKVAEAYNIFIDSHLSEIDNDDELRKKFYYKLMWLNYQLRNKGKSREFLKKIPKSDLKFLFKAYLLSGIYEMFALDTAGKIHDRISRLI